MCNTRFDELALALQRLDGLLGRAVALMHEHTTPGTEADLYRGLHISETEVVRLLSRRPGKPLLWSGKLGEDPETSESDSPLGWLSRTYGLTGFDVDIVLLSLAPEIDLRYERLYAYLQDDVTRKRPSVDLALNLLCATPEDKLAYRCRFAPDASLICHGIVAIESDLSVGQGSFLSRSLSLDDQIVGWLLGVASLAPSLDGFGSWSKPRIALSELWLKQECKRRISTLVRSACSNDSPLLLYLHGRQSSGKRCTAEALAKDNDLRLLTVDLNQDLVARTDWSQCIRRLFREALFRDAMLFINDVDILLNKENALRAQALAIELKQFVGIAILAGTDPWAITGLDVSDMIRVPIETNNLSTRRSVWKTQTANIDVCMTSSELETLSARFRLTPGQIVKATASARASARWRAVDQESNSKSLPIEPGFADYVRAAREQAGHGLAKLAQKIEPKYRWEHMVLPEDQLTLLHELIEQAACRHIVYGQWGFDRRLSLGKGINALFSGPPGTGKTMAAEVIAHALQLDLYKIDLSQIVSKYIGDTEKNLDRIFTEAENANAILFFDEADALFGKRSEVRDAHDRYANIEVGYLLQKMEEHVGIAILATNLRQHIDGAFLRRMQVVIEFPFPDETFRQKIWEGLFPPEAPLAADMNFGALAREVRLAGGSIKNIGLAAAFYAAGEGSEIHMDHVLRAVRREYQKLGRDWQMRDESAADTEAVAFVARAVSAER